MKFNGHSSLFKRGILMGLMTMILQITVKAQSSSTDSVASILRCASAEYLKGLQARGLAESDEHFENWMQNSITEGRSMHATNNTSTGTILYKIPIIFHIIHHGETEGTGNNVSVAQVQSQLNRLNLDYQKLNSDTANIPSWFKPVAANIQFQFVPATVNPRTGAILAEPGIDRYNGGAATYNSTASNTFKAATIFCPDSYFNVWVATFGGDYNGLLGIATFPASSTNCGMPGNPCGNDAGSAGTCTTAGVMIGTTAFGDQVGTAASPYNLGRTLSHESGHYFGLRHTWGDGSCLNDFCDDIPLEKTSYFGNPGVGAKVTTTTYSCSAAGATTTPVDGSAHSNAGTNGIMYEDYMDYSDDAAMYMFTNNQKTRIHTTMWKSPQRNTLATSQTYLLPPTRVGILTNTDTVCQGGSITFSDSTTYSNTMVPTKWAYTFVNTGGGSCTAPAKVVVTNFSSPIAVFEGQPTDGNNPTGSTTVTFPSPGTYTVTLSDTVFLNKDNAATASSCALCKTNWVNSTTHTVVVLPNPALSLTPTGPVSCTSSVNLLATGTPATACGTTGVNVSSYSWSPSINLSCSNCNNPVAVPSVNTTYTVTATDLKGCSSTASVLVNACTVTPVQLLSFSGINQGANNLITWSTSSEFNTNHFELEFSYDGRNFTSIGNVMAAGNSSVVKTYSFIHQNVGKTFIYYRLKQVDNTSQFQYSRVIKIDNRDKSTAIINIRPNPASQYIDLMLQSKDMNAAEVVIIDMLGRVMQQQPISIVNTDQPYRIDISKLPAGTYSVKLVDNNNVSIKQFIKQ